MQRLSALSAANLFEEVKFLQDVCHFKQTFQPPILVQMHYSIRNVFPFFSVPVLYQDNGRHPQLRRRAELPHPALLPPPSLHPHVEARRLLKLDPKEPGPLPG